MELFCFLNSHLLKRPRTYTVSNSQMAQRRLSFGTDCARLGVEAESVVLIYENRPRRVSTAPDRRNTHTRFTGNREGIFDQERVRGDLPTFSRMSSYPENVPLWA